MGMNEPTRSPSQITTASAACLVAAPLIAVVGRLQATPWLEDPAEYLAEISRHPGRSDLGAQLILLSALLFIPAAIALAGLVGVRRRRLALFGGVLAVAGAVGLAATAVASLIAGQMSRVDNRGAMVELEDRILTEPPMQMFPLLLAAGAVGSVALAVGLYRSRAVPRPAAVLVGLGGATTMLTAAGPVRAAVVTAAVLALAGFAWVAATTRPDPAGRFSQPTVGTPLNVTS